MAFRIKLRQALTMACFLAVAAPAMAETVTYTYDARGRLATASYSTGHTTTYSYDAAGNRTQLAVSGGSGGSNLAPDAVNDYDTWAVFSQGDFPTSRVVYVLANDTDPESNTLSISSVTTPTNSASATILTSAPGPRISVTNIGSQGTTFSYTISDGAGGSDTATVTLVPSYEPCEFEIC
ncbi:MAG: cadherin-like domain-containing protein [Caulobacter sp.]|nr:cadherin-like domain-containing protein [Caulobacter sp.]